MNWEITHQQDDWFMTASAPQPQVEDTVVIEDRVPEIKVSIPDTKPVTLLPGVKDPVLSYRSQRLIGRGSFQDSEYNLAEIGRIEDTDGYVRQAFGKKTALMFKEGWDLVGKNPRTIKYMKTRLAQIAQASGIPTNTLFRNIGSNIVRKSNAFVLKVRNVRASGGRVRGVPGKAVQLKPVAAYFPLPAEAMRFQLSGNVIVKWKQQMPTGDEAEHAVKDIVHITYDRKDGFIFGTPTVTPVIDDIRALRKIEENVELLVYQHLFPLFQYKVGTETMPAGINELGQDEIEVVKREIMYMPTEGGIVTPERHEIKAIGAEGRALRAEAYVDHFKKRVFSGLGVSAVDMGEGETANRATADNMSRNMVDGVKDLQQVLEDAINHQIINELLLESTFGEDVLDEENIVRIKFKEIDVEAQIKKETHAADLFSKDIIDHDEARHRMGREPWVVPSPEEVQSGNDMPENYPQWHKSRWKMFQLPTLLIQSLDEPYSPIAQASAADSSLPITEQGNKQAAKEKNDQEITLEKEKTKAKVAVAKAKPAPRSASRKDGVVRATFEQTKKDVVSRVTKQGSLDYDWVTSLIRTQMSTTIRRLQVDQLTAFRRGYSTIASVETQTFVFAATNARRRFEERSNHYITKLTNDIVGSLKRNVQIDTEDMTAKTRAVFDALEYRTSFIEDVEIRKANTLGYAYALKDTTPNVIVASQSTNDNACPTCKSRDGVGLDATTMIMDLIPPHHANCSCTFHIVDTTVSFQNAADKPLPEQVSNGDVVECIKCGKTTLRMKDSPDSFKCGACKTVFKNEQKVVSHTPETQDEPPKNLTAIVDPRTLPSDSVEDKKNKGLGPKSKATAYEKCKRRLEAKLRGRHPDWSDDQILAATEAACIHHLDSVEADENSVEDATLEECVLAVKKSLRKEHPDWSSDKIKSSAYAICNSRRKGK